MSGAASYFFQALTFVGSLLIVLKLFRTQLGLRYRMFYLLLLFQAPNTIWPLLVNHRSALYAYIWATTEPITWILYALAVLELYRLILENHKGLYTLGRWIMYGSIVLAVFFSILSLLPHFTPATPQGSRILGYFYATERGIFSTLLIFLLLIFLFLSRYPVRLNRNVLVHTALYTVYFISQTLAMLLLTVFGVRIASINMATAAITMGCVFAWFFLLTPKGEESQTNLPIFSYDYERRALDQLNAINATLLKAGRS